MAFERRVRGVLGQSGGQEVADIRVGEAVRTVPEGSGGVDPQNREQVVVVPAGPFDLQPHAALARLALERIQGQPPQRGEILGGVSLAGTALIF